MNEQIILSEYSDCLYLITQEWLWVSRNLKYIGNAIEVSKNDLLCGFICEPTDNGFKEYGFDGKSKRHLSPTASFESLLTSLNVELNKSWNIYKQIK